MGGFVKVYSSILASSVWGESLATRVVWITMLAMADRNGLVEASSDGIARAANISLRQSDAALEVLSSPDSRSKTDDEQDGRRIARIDGGYQILNYLKYRELQTPKQQKTAARQRKFREKQEALRNAPVTHGNADVTAINAQRQKQKQKQIAKAEETTKTTTVDSGESKNGKSKRRPPESPSWVVEGREWWKQNVGTITPGHFGRALTDAVGAHGWPQVFDALKCYVEDTKARHKPAKPEWFSSDIIHWLEWAKMPATDEEGGLTARGRAIVEARA